MRPSRAHLLRLAGEEVHVLGVAEAVGHAFGLELPFGEFNVFRHAKMTELLGNGSQQIIESLVSQRH